MRIYRASGKTGKFPAPGLPVHVPLSMLTRMLDQDWRLTTLHMLDFEGAPASGVVEYGIVTLREGRIQYTATDLCQPAGPIAVRDRDVHGIDSGAAAGRPAFATLYAAFVDLRRSGILAAHNRNAENSFLKATWPVPPQVPDWRLGEPASAQEWGPWIDTLSLYRNLYPGLDSYALGNLIDSFDCREKLDELAAIHCPPERRRPHAALYDALASALLLLRLEESDGLRGRISTGWLFRMSEAAPSQGELF